MLVSLTLSLLASFHPNVAVQDTEVVYGEDTRLDLDELDDAELAARVARSSAAQLPLAMISVNESSGALIFGNRRLGEAYGLCEDEAFIDQLAIATCSGTLIAPNLVLTAGHCVHTETLCAGRGWLFGFDQSVSDGSSLLSSEHLYTCRSVHALRFEWDYGREWDYAVVELDRPVAAPYGPATLASSAPQLMQQEALFVVSYPSGLPLKIDLDARVVHIRNDDRDYFTLMADTFSGSSGGGIFSADSGALIGILVRSSGDYVNDPVDGCRRVLQREEPGPMSGYYESGSYADTAVEAFCATVFGGTQPLCAEPEPPEEPTPPKEPTPPSPEDADDRVSFGGGGGCQSGAGVLGTEPVGWALALFVLLMWRRSSLRQPQDSLRP